MAFNDHPLTDKLLPSITCPDVKGSRTCIGGFDFFILTLVSVL